MKIMPGKNNNNESTPKKKTMILKLWSLKFVIKIDEIFYINSVTSD